jgi:hypothetical protein
VAEETESLATLDWELGEQARIRSIPAHTGIGRMGTLKI